MNLKQPVAGILATALVVAISLGFISLFSFPMFRDWISYSIICMIPMQIVIGVIWGGKYPTFAGSRPQPAKGILLTLFAVVIGLIVNVIALNTIGGGMTPPRPMLAQCTIVSVV